MNTFIEKFDSVSSLGYNCYIKFYFNSRKMNQETQFLEYIVKAMVDNPDAVKIVRSVDDMGVLLNLTVAPEDMGKIIGRKGNTAGAIRTLLRVVGMKNNARVNLKINEPEGRSPQFEREEIGGQSYAPRYDTSKHSRSDR